jgi:hypothetical protein
VGNNFSVRQLKGEDWMVSLFHYFPPQNIFSCLFSLSRVWPCPFRDHHLLLACLHPHFLSCIPYICTLIFLHNLFLCPEDDGSRFFYNTGIFLQDYMVPHPRRQSSYSPLQESEISNSSSSLNPVYVLHIVTNRFQTS